MGKLEIGSEIVAERISLRGIYTGDAERITLLIKNWNVIQWLSNPPYPYRLGDAEAFVARVNAEEMTWRNVRLAIEIEGLLAGVIGHAPSGDCSPHLGYWLGEPYWGKGYMTEAVSAFLTSYFSVADNNEITSCVLRGNEASLRLQRSLGFEIVGESELYCRPHDGLRPAIGTRLTREYYEARPE